MCQKEILLKKLKQILPGLENAKQQIIGLDRNVETNMAVVPTALENRITC